MHLQSLDTTTSERGRDTVPVAAAVAVDQSAAVSRERLEASPHCHRVTGQVEGNKEEEVEEEEKNQTQKVNHYSPPAVHSACGNFNCSPPRSSVIVETATSTNNSSGSSNATNEGSSVTKVQQEQSQSVSKRKVNASKLKLILPNLSDISSSVAAAATLPSLLTDENRSASVPCLLNVDEERVTFTSEKRPAGESNYFFVSTSRKYPMNSGDKVGDMDTSRNGKTVRTETDALLSHHHHHHHRAIDGDRVTESPLLPPVRRAMSLSSSYPDPAQICRMRRLYCPRQPPTMLRRTLSISRTNLSKKKKKKLTSYQKNLLFCLSMVSFTSFLCMSIMAPFFPLEASTKGMSGTISGLVFSCYALVVMLASPLLGSILPRVGAKFMLISGIFAAGITNILFGMLNQIESTQSFTIYCFLVRSCEALSAAAFSTASYTYIMYSFPDDIGTAFGLTETCVGLGMSLGPAIGSALYAIGGYGTPFYVLGTLILINLPVCWYLVKPIDTLKRTSDDGDDKKVDFTPTVVKNGYFSLITIPEVAVVCFVVVSVSQSQGFLDPTLEPHFRQYNISAEFVGLAFLLMSASYAILSPFIGKIAGKFNNRYPLMIAGLMISFIGFLLLGPSPFIPFNTNIWTSSFSMILIGFGYAIAFIPTFECILLLAIKKGFEDNVKTYSLVSGLWSSMYSFGEVIGPTIGGLFVDQFDFRIGSTLIAIISLLTALLTTITSLIKCYPNCSSDNSTATFADSSDEEEEEEESYENNLLSNHFNHSSFSRQSNLLPQMATCQSLIGTAGTIDSGIGDALVSDAAASSTLHRKCPFDVDVQLPILKKTQGGSVSYLSPSYGTSSSAFREFGNSV